MKELVKVFNEAVLPIEVINEKEFMIDVSGIAKSHGKNFTHWRKSKGVKEYLSALQKCNAVKRTLINTTIVGKTLIHNSLLIIFARWISPEFAIWCDNIIYEMLTASKEEEIKLLKSEKKLCMIDSDGYSSIRGIAQRTDYTESQIQEFFVKLGAIEDSIRPTRYWHMKNDCNGLLKTRGEFQTPYIKFDSAINLLKQYYN